MIYHIEFVRWDEGRTNPVVIERISEHFASSEHAFLHAKPMMDARSVGGATAIRIYEDGQSPTSIAPRKL